MICVKGHLLQPILLTESTNSGPLPIVSGPAYIPPHCQCTACYDFFLTCVEHTFSSSFLDYLTLAATCAEGSLFISTLLFT